VTEIVKAWEVSSRSHTLVVAIPKAIRSELKLENGHHFWLWVDGGRIVLKPLGKGSKELEVVRKLKSFHELEDELKERRAKDREVKITNKDERSKNHREKGR